MSPLLGLSLVLTFVGFLILEMQSQKCKRLNICTHFISNTFISNARLKLAKKVKQVLDNTLRLKFWYLKILGILFPRYHPKIIEHILKNSQMNKYVCTHEFMRLIIMKIKIKTKNRSHRYDISRRRPTQGQNYSKFKVSQYGDACMS